MGLQLYGNYLRGSCYLTPCSQPGSKVQLHFGTDVDFRINNHKLVIVGYCCLLLLIFHHSDHSCWWFCHCWIVIGLFINHHFNILQPSLAPPMWNHGVLRSPARDTAVRTSRGIPRPSRCWIALCALRSPARWRLHHLWSFLPWRMPMCDRFWESISETICRSTTFGRHGHGVHTEATWSWLMKFMLWVMPNHLTS